MPIDSSNILGIINEEEVVRAAIATSATRTNSELHRTVCEQIREQFLDTVENQKQKKKIDVRRDLTQEQLQTLNELYPERHIVTSGCERGTHSFAAASRKIETDLLLSRMPKNANVYDIGGNWATHLKRKDTRKVHCCCPVLDFRDAQRKTTRWLSVEKFLSEKDSISEHCGQKVLEIQEDEDRISNNLRKGAVAPEDLTGRWYCENRFEDCVYRAEKAYGMAIHSIYDISLDDLVNAMEEKRIKYLVGTFLFSVELFLGKKRGELTSVDGFFEIDGGNVKYGFYDDTNCGYRHDLQQLMEYLTKTFVKAKGGSVFYLELTEQRGDVMFFSLTDATEARMHGVVEDESFKCIPIESKDSVVFPLFELNKKSDELEFTEVLLPKSFVRRTIEYTARLKTNQLNPETVNSYLTSTNNTVIIGGSAKKTVEKVDAMLIPQITTTLIVWTELMNARQKKVLDRLRIQMKDDVGFMALAHASFSKMFGKVSFYQKALRSYANWISYCHGTDAIEFKNVPLYVEVKDRVKMWKQHAPNHGFSFDLEDLDEKIQLYKETERERKAISEFVVSDKLGDLSAAVCEKEAREVSVEYRDRRRKVEATDLRNGEVFTNFVDEWCNKEDHFNHVHIEVENKYSLLVKIVIAVWEAIVPPMQFAPVYIDDEERDPSDAESVVELDLSETDDGSGKGDYAEKPGSVEKAEKPIEARVSLEKGKEKVEVEDSAIRRGSGSSSPDSETSMEDELVSDGESLFGRSCQATIYSSTSLYGSSENDKSVGSASSEIDSRVLEAVEAAIDEMEKEVSAEVLAAVVVVTESSEPEVSEVVVENAATVECKEQVVVDTTDSESDEERAKSWGSMAEEESDDTFYMNTMLISNKVQRSSLPKQPDFNKYNTVQQKAKQEYLWYLRCKMISDRTTLRSIIEDHLNGLYHNGNCDLPKNSCFLDYTKSVGGEWLYAKPLKAGHCYGVGFSLNSKGKISKCELLKLMWDVDARGQPLERPFNTKMFQFVLLNDLTFLMNEMIIFRNLQDTLQRKERTKQASIVLKDGVPGCGKSTWILNNANYIKDVVISVGKEAKEDLKEKFMKKYKCTESELGRIRTVDSYLMHDCGKKLRATTVHFDEALMTHAGAVYFCADLLGARKVICQGDSQQIPFVNRVESIKLQFAKLVIDKTDLIRMTYRSPIDVAHYLNYKSFYTGGRITTKNEVVRSMSVVGPRNVRPMTSVYSVPYVPGVQYLTFTQTEKDDLFKALRSKGHVNVNTVHETQGKTFDDVILVRLKTTENEIYPGGRNSKPYTIVGLTRHRRSLVYYTAIEDRLFFDLTEMRGVMEDKLLKNLNVENGK
uniref:152-kDa protein n=1 Tax=Japanese soil-borne wheat mosaic virus TaxID=2030954 RepID=A0A4P2VT15_9VIRU|nr:152-kDa protein [Japanese soil-borne wheat mosaic virus]